MGKIFTPENISSGFNTTNSLNTNFDNIEAALDKCLSRTGETPNAMAVDLDMNNFDILNAGTVSCDTLVISGDGIPNLEQITDARDQALSDISGQVTAAQTFANQAEAAETTAKFWRDDAESISEDVYTALVSIDLPIIDSGDAGKILVVTDAVDGYTLQPRDHSNFVKPELTMRSSGTTPVADPHLTGTLLTGVYEITGYLDYLSPLLDTGVKLVFTTDAGFTITTSATVTADNNNYVLSSSNQVDLDVSVARILVAVKGVAVVTGLSGTFSLDWSQHNDTALGSTTLNPYSYLSFRKIADV